MRWTYGTVWPRKVKRHEYYDMGRDLLSRIIMDQGLLWWRPPESPYSLGSSSGPAGMSAYDRYGNMRLDLI